MDALAALLAGLALGGIIALGWGWVRIRRLERELGETRRQLERARAARDSFFDLTTHELRSPLAAILGFQELLEDNAFGDLSEEAMDAVERIGHAGRHLLNMVDGVMELSRIRTGAVRVDLHDVDAGVLFTTAAEQFRTRTRERGITPDVRLPDRPVSLRSDPERLARAFDLLITSAVRHPRGAGMTMVISADDGLVLSLGPTNLEVDEPDQGPDEAGIRLAVVHGIAQILGGGLELRFEGDRVRELLFRIPTSPPAPGL